MQLTGNTIFITGGGSGIGRGLAEAFHKLGNTVIISGRRAAALEAVTAANPGMASIVVDIADPASIAAAAAQLIRDFPALNVLINNAGIMPFDNVAGPVNDAEAESVVTTNLLGPIRVTSALIEHLKAQPRATIVYNSSALAFTPLAPSAVYSATKAAIHSYALSQRFMLRDTSVGVQEIAPPWVDTDLVEASGGMPLADFIAGTMEQLATDAEEIVVGDAKVLRDNPGPNEHGLVNGFNAQMVAAFSGAA
ncbi:SDR family NAD(P)-dependent oxidoreductase [Sphingomonas sp. TF3]|uniref:SDR family oxidoreductase n=1 Tax=Sphingomonas sp. TF3 TaxID=2495580 RepID=UPI000F8688C4|nr:SDR family NAD(P)-dependent oxidoreductase [Sphingomonas sp. TF3]RUN78309.1 SDR family NAD(P)-dependent oxidoreductase [Sphingomonas sp. TF3]